jgi:hypothetical protein
MMAKLEAKFENEIEGEDFLDLSKFIKFLMCGGVRCYIENVDKENLVLMVSCTLSMCLCVFKFESKSIYV